MGLAEQLIGSWRLVSFEYLREGGETIYAYGRRPVGLLVYDRAGFMTAQIMNPDRPRFASGDRRRGTLEELGAAVEGYIAYFGTYEVHERDGYVLHREQGDLFPNAVGTSQRRHVRLTGDRLELDVPPIMLGGVRTTARVVWERIAGA